jgi:hypothetical protein
MSHRPNGGSRVKVGSQLAGLPFFGAPDKGNFDSRSAHPIVVTSSWVRQNPGREFPPENAVFSGAFIVVRVAGGQIPSEAVDQLLLLIDGVTLCDQVGDVVHNDNDVTVLIETDATGGKLEMPQLLLTIFPVKLPHDADFMKTNAVRIGHDGAFAQLTGATVGGFSAVRHFIRRCSTAQRLATALIEQVFIGAVAEKAFDRLIESLQPHFVVEQ